MLLERFWVTSDVTGFISSSHSGKTRSQSGSNLFCAQLLLRIERFLGSIDVQPSNSKKTLLCFVIFVLMFFHLFPFVCRVRTSNSKKTLLSFVVFFMFATKQTK